MVGRCMSQWWDVSSEAGPKSRPNTQFLEDPPTLELLSINHEQHVAQNLISKLCFSKSLSGIKSSNGCWVHLNYIHVSPWMQIYSTSHSWGYLSWLLRSTMPPMRTKSRCWLRRWMMKLGLQLPWKLMVVLQLPNPSLLVLQPWTMLGPVLPQIGLGHCHTTFARGSQATLCQFLTLKAQTRYSLAFDVKWCNPPAPKVMISLASFAHICHLFFPWPASFSQVGRFLQSGKGTAGHSGHHHSGQLVVAQQNWQHHSVVCGWVVRL